MQVKPTVSPLWAKEGIMSEVPKIIEDFLKGNNDAGGTISSLEEEAKRLALQVEALENIRDTAYNAALEWAADWIIGAQLSGHGVEVQRYANTMAMSIRAAKRGLTPRALDGAYSRPLNKFIPPQK